MQAEQYQNQQEQKEVVHPLISKGEQKMYQNQLRFMSKLKNELQQFQASIQKLLIEMSGFEEGSGKRLPYNVFRAFDRNLKELLKMNEGVREENKKYELHLAEREKMKVHKNNQFKIYLNCLNDCKHEQKQYISRLEARVQKLEDSGYAQYVEFDAKMPESKTLRFSYSTSILLSLVENRGALGQQLEKNLRKNKKAKAEYSKKYRKSSNIHLSLLKDPQTSLADALSSFSSYTYFITYRFLPEKLLRRVQKKQEHRIAINKLTKALKAVEQQKVKVKLELSINSSSSKLTRTDYMIYLKLCHREIQAKLAEKFFMFDQSGRKRRAYSYNKHDRHPKYGNYDI